MSNGDQFAGGFLTGAILGGILGGVLGATLANRSAHQRQELEAGDPGKAQRNGKARGKTQRRRWVSGSNGNNGMELSFSSEERIEAARHSLEDKIAQLNRAIDEARQQLGDTAPAEMPESHPQQDSLG